VVVFSYKVYIYQFVIRTRGWLINFWKLHNTHTSCEQPGSWVWIDRFQPPFTFLQFNINVLGLFFSSFCNLHFYSSFFSFFFFLICSLEHFSIMFSWDNLLLKDVGCNSDINVVKECMKRCHKPRDLNDPL